VRTSVITIVAGRAEHLSRQRAGLARSSVAADEHVVVTMGTDAGISDALSRNDVPTRRTHVDVEHGAGLPLAAARNAGAEAALAGGAQLLVFLDVDCIPAATLVHRYASAATALPTALLAGPVAYLPAAPPTGYDLTALAALAAPHPARPVPPDFAVVPEPRTELFWSLSFALTADTWRRVGGFYPGYVGYGAEDTDFALLAAAAGARLHWVGGATAYHQYHGPSGPTAANAASIVRNARLFHSRHGWWPMGDWLRQLHTDGLVDFRPAEGVVELLAR
jgi:GT2 family glycosyltransferase